MKKLACAFFVLFLCRYSADAGEFFYTDGKWIKDSCGRVVILHSLNVSDANKRPDAKTGKFFPHWLTKKSFERIAAFGFNSVRLLISWEALEPERGKYDAAYINEIKEKVKWAKDAGLVVIIDMHQDVYARCKFGGNGAPCWSVIDDGKPFKHTVWYMDYVQPAVMRAFDNFWKDTQEIQTHFTGAWVNVAKAFKDEDAVIGYDLLNEPFPGSYYFKNDLFDELLFQPFYERLIGEIHKVDKNHICFIEPNAVRTNALAPKGFPSALEPFKFKNLAYAPHFYDPITTMNVRYDKDKTRLQKAMKVLMADAERLNLPVWMGEFSLWGDYQLPGGAEFLDDQLNAFNDALAGWAFWDWNEGAWNFPFGTDEKWKWLRERLSFPYPSKIAGEPVKFAQDVKNGTMFLEYGKTASTCDTEIRFPSSTPAKNISVKVEKGDYETVKDGVVLIHHSASKELHSVEVRINR